MCVWIEVFFALQTVCRIHRLSGCQDVVPGATGKELGTRPRLCTLVAHLVKNEIPGAMTEHPRQSVCIRTIRLQPLDAVWENSGHAATRDDRYAITAGGERVD